MDVYTISTKCVSVSLKSTLAGFTETLDLLHHVAHVPELFVNPLASGTSCHCERRNKTVLLESVTVWKTGGQLWGQRSNYTSERLIWVQLQRLSARQTDGGVQRERRAKAGRIERGVDSWPCREKGWRSFSLVSDRTLLPPVRPLLYTNRLPFYCCSRSFWFCLSMREGYSHMLEYSGTF